MKEVYRKRGRTLRYERGPLGEALIRVAEAGEAWEEGPRFGASPLGGDVPLPEVAEEDLSNAVAGIARLVQPPLTLERLIVTEGNAQHEFEGRRWADGMRRLHVSLICAPLRVLIDCGDFDLRELGMAAEHLALSNGQEKEPPPVICLAPHIAAAMVPFLVTRRLPGMALRQVGGGVDGKGQLVDELALGGLPWPNWYRPSYRSRPQRMPMNVAIEAEIVEMEASVPRAVALLAPPDGLRLRVLCVQGEEIGPMTIHVGRVVGVAGPRRWYPYGAGAYGSEMMVSAASS